uniref:Uncharacterized protein n=1 Tax=uncultured bacterium 5G4 TaxID=1701326 RepID=A0A166H2S4_9BACT|nr:hypothetical protein 5G4_010 [uncultured bacterium 5G4]
MAWEVAPQASRAIAGLYLSFGDKTRAVNRISGKRRIDRSVEVFGEILHEMGTKAASRLMRLFAYCSFRSAAPSSVPYLSQP